MVSFKSPVIVDLPGPAAEFCTAQQASTHGERVSVLSVQPFQLVDLYAVTGHTSFMVRQSPHLVGCCDLFGLPEPPKWAFYEQQDVRIPYSGVGRGTHLAMDR